MTSFYLMVSDFYVHEDENTSSTMVENVADQLDKLLSSGEANNRVVPIFIARGGTDERPEYSLEPLYFTVVNKVPIIFSTCFRLHGESLETIDCDGGGGTFIMEMLSYNNANVYPMGVANSSSDVEDALRQAAAGNLLKSDQIDPSMVTELVIQNGLEPLRVVKTPNGGEIDVYALAGAEMDSLMRDKNYGNAAGRTFVDYDNSESAYNLIGIGGSPSIREVAIRCCADGFMYTVWTINMTRYVKRAAEIAEYFPVECIENDLTDMTNALGEHIIMHMRKRNLFDSGETSAFVHPA